MIQLAHDAMAAQREKVDAAWQAWNRADREHEEAAWMELQAEQMKLDALIKREKVKVG